MKEIIIMATKDPRFVIPAEAGISWHTPVGPDQIPAFAGMTGVGPFRCRMNNNVLNVIPMDTKGR